jgi:hypothetical protein
MKTTVKKEVLTSPFEKLLGKRVLVPFPTEDKKKAPVTKILMPEGLEKKREEEMSQELIKKYMRIPVIQIGDEVTRVKAGDEIYVPARCLAPGRSDAISIDDKMYFIIAESDIAGVY